MRNFRGRYLQWKAAWDPARHGVRCGARVQSSAVSTPMPCIRRKKKYSGRERALPLHSAAPTRRPQALPPESAHTMPKPSPGRNSDLQFPYREFPGGCNRVRRRHRRCSPSNQVAVGKDHIIRAQFQVGVAADHAPVTSGIENVGCETNTAPGWACCWWQSPSQILQPQSGATGRLRSPAPGAAVCGSRRAGPSSASGFAGLRSLPAADLRRQE